jgi:hypothetical protein
VFIDTLHPIREGRVFRWERDKAAGYGSLIAASLPHLIELRL